MPAEGVPPRAHDEILSLRGARRLRPRGRRARHQQGAHHRRRAAGAPGLRRLRRHAGAHQRHRRHLADHQRPAAAALRRRAAPRGLRRVNVSIDSLDAGALRALTRGGRLGRRARRPRRGVRRRLLAGQGQRAAARGRRGRARRLRRPHARAARCTCASSSSCRSTGASSVDGRIVPAPHVLELLRARHALEPVDGPYGHGPARYWSVPGAPGTIGFIAGVSEHFCESCNRLRLTADGRLRTCLFSGEETDHAAADRRSRRRCARRSSGRSPARPTTAAASARQRARDVADRRVR